MNNSGISGGLVHELPKDLIIALTATDEITNLWESITQIARNEFICWVEDGKLKLANGGFAELSKNF